jgi:hypothetical protein
MVTAKTASSVEPNFAEKNKKRNFSTTLLCQIQSPIQATKFRFKFFWTLKKNLKFDFHSVKRSLVWAAYIPTYAHIS